MSSLLQAFVAAPQGDKDWTAIILIAVAAGILVAAFVCGIIIYKYKKKLKSPIYPLDRYANLNLNTFASSDIFIGKSVTRVRVNNSSRRRR